MVRHSSWWWWLLQRLQQAICNEYLCEASTRSLMWCNRDFCKLSTNMVPSASCPWMLSFQVWENERKASACYLTWQNLQIIAKPSWPQSTTIPSDHHAMKLGFHYATFIFFFRIFNISLSTLSAWHWNISFQPMTETQHRTRTRFQTLLITKFHTSSLSFLFFFFLFFHIFFLLLFFFLYLFSRKRKRKGEWEEEE